MESIGVVIATNNERATVKVKRASACGENCAHCKGGCETTTAQAVVENTIGAVVGDTVKIESNTTDVVRAAFFLYMLPVLVAIVSSVVAYGIKMSDFFVILISVAAFFVSFIIIKRFEKKLTPKSYITKILSKGVK